MAYKLTRLQKRALWLPSYGNGVGILQVCESLHGSTSGSSDPLKHGVEQHYVKFLECCLDTWDGPCGGSENFDLMVNGLICATLEEVRLKNGCAA